MPELTLGKGVVSLVQARGGEASVLPSTEGDVHATAKQAANASSSSGHTASAEDSCKTSRGPAKVTRRRLCPGQPVPSHPQTVFVDEAGVWRLLLGCRKPELEPVKEWLTSEVLPTIRRTGGYSIDTSAGSGCATN